MTRTAKQFYVFGPFRIDRSERLLLRDGEPIALTPRVFDTLIVLVENSGHILSKEEVMKKVWADSIVEEANLTKNISTLRKALGQTSETVQYIETIPWRGYRFIEGVQDLSEEQSNLPSTQLNSQSTQIQESSASSRETLRSFSDPESYEQSYPFSELLKRRMLNGIKPLAVSISIAISLVVIFVVIWSTGKKTEDKGAPKSTAAPKTIAILPFKSLSVDPGDEYLGLGLADTLITRLSTIKRLIVRPTGAVRKYSGNDQDPFVAGREQQVDAILDGSLLKTEGRIRVTARLLRVDDGTALWAGSFDEKDSDLFRLQDLIVEKLAGALTLELTGEEHRRLTRQYTDNTEAYLLYLRGRYHLERRTINDVKKSIDYFREALAIDSNYALAYAGLAESYPSLSVLGEITAGEVMPKAKEAVGKALAVDDQLVEAYASQGLIKTIYDWDWVGAEQDLKRALSLGPNSALAHRIYGHYLRTTGRLDQALVEFNQSVALEPLSLVGNRDLGVTLYCMRDYERSITQFKKTIELDPNFGTVYGFLERALEATGRYDQAVDADMNSLSRQGSAPEFISALRKAYNAAGWKGYWRKRLEVAIDRSKRGEYDQPYQIALIYLRIGENAKAIEWIERAYDERDFWLNFLKVEPLLDGIRQDVRYIEVLRRVGLQ